VPSDNSKREEEMPWVERVEGGKGSGALCFEEKDEDQDRVTCFPAEREYVMEKRRAAAEGGVSDGKAN